VRRAELVKIRQRQGKPCRIEEPYSCAGCKQPVQCVVVREEPRMFMVFNAGELGRVHSCQKRRVFAH
jgi:hypothetical protein